jgi:transcriptional regulator with XRE-family HTH domain
MSSDRKNFRKATKTTEVSIGESVRIIRELQELSQNALATVTGIPQSTISAIEHDRVKLGVERAKVLARALKCHPAVLVFPEWEMKMFEVAEDQVAYENRVNEPKQHTK